MILCAENQLPKEIERQPLNQILRIKLLQGRTLCQILISRFQKARNRIHTQSFFFVRVFTAAINGATINIDPKANAKPKKIIKGKYSSKYPVNFFPLVNIYVEVSLRLYSTKIQIYKEKKNFYGP